MWNVLPQRKNAPGIVYVLQQLDSQKKGSINPADYKGCYNPIILRVSVDVDGPCRESCEDSTFLLLFTEGLQPRCPLLVFSSLSVGNPIKRGHVFVCAQHPVLGCSEGGGPAENSFANRWELAGPLAREARFSRFSQECCRTY